MAKLTFINKLGTIKGQHPCNDAPEHPQEKPKLAKRSIPWWWATWEQHRAPGDIPARSGPVGRIFP
jgi:hypothetical protein